MKQFKNILIVRTDRIGDVVLTTPCLRALRQSYHQAKISMLVTPLTQDLVEENPFLDEIIIDDRQQEHKGLRGFVRLVTMLRRKKFDLAIIFHTKKRTNLTCFLAGIPYRIGYRNNKFGFLLTHSILDTRHEGRKHEAQYCLDVLEHLGIPADGLELDVSIKDKSEQWVDQILRQNNITDQDQLVAVHVGASDPSKRWPEYRFAEFIDQLVEKYGSKVFLIGASETKSISQKVVSLSRAIIFDLTGKTTISQLASLLKRCDLLVSNDSGPVHVAVGVGTPVVSIFTRNQPGINPERWKPLGQNSRVVSVLPTNNISFAKAQPVVDPKYMELISTQEVLQAVDAIFKLC